MKKYLIITFISIACTAGIKAQEYKVHQSSGKLLLNLSAVTVEGYSGNEIIFTTTREESEMDPRAKGLQAINGAGYRDNTGLGISVVEKGGAVEVHQVASADLAIKIMVPKSVILSLACHKMSNAGKIILKNMENEIEISTDYNSVELENVSGPVSVRALYGSVDARFNEHIKGPISIASIYSAVDVTIPPGTKANVKLSSPQGNILAAADLKIEMEHNGENGMISYSNTVNGKLNGGGLEFKLNSEFGKIYLRSSK